jgi:hypothetical protein
MMALAIDFAGQSQKFPKLYVFPSCMSSQAVCLPKLYVPGSISSARLSSFKSIKSTLISHSESMEGAEREISAVKRNWREVQVRSEKFESVDNHRRSRQRARGGDRPSANAERRARLPEHGRPADCSSHSWRGRHRDRAIQVGRWRKVFRKGHFWSVPAILVPCKRLDLADGATTVRKPTGAGLSVPYAGRRRVDRGHLSWETDAPGGRPAGPDGSRLRVSGAAWV